MHFVLLLAHIFLSVNVMLTGLLPYHFQYLLNPMCQVFQCVLFFNVCKHQQSLLSIIRNARLLVVWSC